MSAGNPAAKGQLPFGSGRPAAGGPRRRWSWLCASAIACFDPPTGRSLPFVFTVTGDAVEIHCYGAVAVWV